MRFLRAFAIALITAVVGMFLAVFASDYLTRLYHVSDMEGQRGMTVIFLFAPLGIIVGFLIGLITALRTHWPGFIGFLKTQALSVLVTIALATVVSGLCWVAADKPPKIDGYCALHKRHDQRGRGVPDQREGEQVAPPIAIREPAKNQRPQKHPGKP